MQPIIKLTGTFLLAAILCPSLVAADRPNIIIVFADDISARELPIYGSSVWSPPTGGNTSDPDLRAFTPVLDQLANEGCWIKTAWASVVCSPSRAMMMTGRYAHLHKWWGNKSKGRYIDESGKESTWPLYLSSPTQIGHVAQQAGYKTYWSGKTQMAGDLNRFGFDQGCFTPGNLSDTDNPFTDFKLVIDKSSGEKVLRNADTNQPVDTYQQHGWYWYPHVRLMNHDAKDFQWWPNTDESKAQFGVETYGPDVELDFVFDFMDQRASEGEPFFVYHTSHLGHDAFDWLNPDSKSKWPGTPSVSWDGEKYTRTQPNITGDVGDYDTHGTVTPPGIHHHVNYLDYQVWLYQNKLEELGIADNTIFIFCADNGTSGYGKNSTDREKGTHVPCIISAPGMTKRGEQDVLVNLSDFLPTIAELTGATLPADYEVNGKSLVPFLFGDQQQHREWLYGYKDNEQIIRGSKVMRDGRGKWWDVEQTPDDLISFPEIKDWTTVSDEHRAPRDKLLAVLPRFDQKTHGKHATGSDIGSEPLAVRPRAAGIRESDDARPLTRHGSPTQSWTTTFEDDYEGRDAIGDQYTTARGHDDSWSVIDGVLVGKQTKDDHGAVIRTELEFDDVDIQFDFRFTGGTSFNLVIDDANEKSVHAGHICRASVFANSLMIGDDKTGAMNLEVRKQRQDKNLSDEAKAALQTLLNQTRSSAKVAIKQNEWHRLRVRIRGDVMKAFLDDALITSLKSPGFAHPTKTKFGFTVNGQSIEFDNLVVRQLKSDEPRGVGRENSEPLGVSPRASGIRESDDARPLTRRGSQHSQPNILWVVTDDQRVDSIVAFNQMRHGTANSPLGKVLSPNIDRLAKMGTTFINTFNQNPGCAPSRTLMHTGRYSHRTGVYGFEYYNPTGQAHWRPMVPEILRDKAGYQTLAVGKLGIRAQHFSNQKGGTKPPLYQTNLGYRKEFAAEGLVDWNKESKWVDGKPGPKNETFYFPGGDQLIWPEFADSTPNDRAEIQKRLGLLRHYMPGDEDKQSGSILGGVNPQTGERTRDGNFTRALLDHLEHSGERYTDMLDRQQNGPAPDKPLFAYVGFEFPHTPVLPPADFREKFQKLKYDIPEFTSEEFAAFPPQLKRLYNNSQSDHFTDAEKHQMIVDYYAFCAYGDSLVGEAVDGFIEFSNKQHRPWLILYVCGDHGWRLNEHGMVSKFSHYDIDLHNPIIVVSSDKARFPAGKVVEDFTCFVDMAPTFLSAAGIDIHTPEYQYLDGRDLAKTAAGVLPPRDYIIAGVHSHLVDVFASNPSGAWLLFLDPVLTVSWAIQG
ncbi:Arylsulfatase [Stieleria neptunia]|uniref:Arylsulfatase n=1 Tax=Stieleria neptunia TaxID=2527979 RepID=A0A518I2V6_9BACT|nr:sulfatase-like hydrolase/transferase [Stieleria neptunia]QDV47441.1 Arylsulfatase [Stieleria neptunia]